MASPRAKDSGELENAPDETTSVFNHLWHLNSPTGQGGAGLSQRELARVLNIPRTTLQDFLTGRTIHPTLATIVRLREGLRGI